MIDEKWHPFLRARGIDVTQATMRSMPGGEINDTWLITAHGGVAEGPAENRSHQPHLSVLRHYRRTTEAAEIDCELSAIDHLARHGFPTPAVIRALSDRTDRPSTGGPSPQHPAGAVAGRWDHVDGRPTVLFTMASGEHPSERSGGYGTLDLALGLQAARLAGALHCTLESAPLIGGRAPERDPWRQIGDFISSPAVHNDLFGELIEPLRQVHARLEPLYADPRSVPCGLIHNDIRPPNLLIDSAGEILALLDFDDCAQTFLGYEFGALIGNFGKDEGRHVIMDRVLQLVSSYGTTRPLTDRERRCLPDLLIAHAGAEGIRVVSHWLAIGNTDVQLRDSYSVIQFLDLVAMRDGLAAALR